MTSTIPPTVAARGGGSNKKVLAIVGGGAALLLILAAVWFFVLRDDSEPDDSNIRLSDELLDEPSEEEVTDDAGVDPGTDPVDPAQFDSLTPFIVQSAGPYAITQESAEPCEPPCIFPPEAHPGSLETYQATWDAGDTGSEIFGEFLLYPSDTEAVAGIAQTAAFLESSGYGEVDTVTIQGLPGTVFQSADSEIVLYQTSNAIMGFHGNQGFPTEFVGYL